MNKINKTWGGQRQGAGRKPQRKGTQKMETYLDPELKQKAVAKAKQLNLSQSDYLKKLIQSDLQQ